MMDKLKMMMDAAKDKKPMSDDEKLMRLKAAKALKSEAMGDAEAGLKKLTVASDSDKGLEEGLEKARELLHAKDGLLNDKDQSNHSAEENEEEDSGEGLEHEAKEEEAEESAMSPEELDAQIEKLMKLKHAKMKK